MREWVDWYNTKVLQKAAVVDVQGNMLAVCRSDTQSGGRPGKWDLPGGSVELRDLGNIKPHEAAIYREITDETGLSAITVGVIFVDSWTFQRSPGTILGIAVGYQATVEGIKPLVHLSHEHTEYL